MVLDLQKNLQVKLGNWVSIKVIDVYGGVNVKEYMRGEDVKCFGKTGGVKTITGLL